MAPATGGLFENKKLNSLDGTNGAQKCTRKPARDLLAACDKNPNNLDIVRNLFIVFRE
jgi:hypothetical protein